MTVSPRAFQHPMAPCPNYAPHIYVQVNTQVRRRNEVLQQDAATVKHLVNAFMCDPLVEKMHSMREDLSRELREHADGMAEMLREMGGDAEHGPFTMLDAGFEQDAQDLAHKLLTIKEAVVLDPQATLPPAPPPMSEHMPKRGSRCMSNQIPEIYTTSMNTRL